MCASGRPPPSPSPTDGGTGSGSQYALCALGVGLVALGMVMIVWSVVPSNVTSDSSRPGVARSRTSSVAVILVGGGMAMLVLAFCLGMRNRRRLERWQGQETDFRFQERNGATEQRASATTRTAESAANYDVPSYEEVVGSGQYPVRQSSLQQNSSQLPSYEDLLDSGEDCFSEEMGRHDDGGISGWDSSELAQSGEQGPNHGRASLRPLALKVRRIKSEKLQLEQPPVQGGPLAMEPLTPPPQYEEKLPAL